MPRSWLACAALALLLPGLAAAQERRGGMERGVPAGGRPGYANPSAVIAAELAFAEDARVRGQWTAFAAAAANDAVMTVPQLVWAQLWLKGRANPAAAVTWQPYEVWSSCDGSLVASHGVWRGSKGQAGWFTTLWRREGDGSYKWVFDHGADGPAVTAEPDMIAAHVADCPARQRRPEGMDDDQRRPRKPPKPAKPIKIAQLPPLDPAHHEGASADGTLRWAVTVGADGARTLTVRWTKDGAETPLLAEPVAAPRAAG